MTREEEIIKAAEKYYNNSELENIKIFHFINGAKWADENPKEANGKEILYVCQRTAERTKKEFIDKACDYLKSLTYQEFAGAPLERLLDDYEINNFVKAMD